MLGFFWSWWFSIVLGNCCIGISIDLFPRLHQHQPPAKDVFLVKSGPEMIRDGEKELYIYIYIQRERESFEVDTLPETNITLENWCLGNDPFFLGRRPIFRACAVRFCGGYSKVLGPGIQIDFFFPWASNLLRQLTSEMLPPPYSARVGKLVTRNVHAKPSSI